MTEADPGGGKGTPSHASAYVSSLRVLLAALLAVICVITGGLAWILHPRSSGFVAVPDRMRILSTEAGPVTQTLTRTADGGTTLQLFEPYGVYPAAPDGVPIGYASGGVTESKAPIVGSFTRRGTQGPVSIPNSRWHYLVLDPGTGWAPCRAGARYLVGTIRFAGVSATAILAPPVPAHAEVSSTAPATAYPSGLCLHWRTGGPVADSGPYLSASFPSMLDIDTSAGDGYTFAVPLPPVGDIGNLPVTRTLILGDGDTADYGIQSDPHPTSSTDSAPASWTWITTTSPQNILFAAVNTTDLQRENNSAFVSGVLFGLAGGALIGLVTELVLPFYEREKHR